MKLNKFIEKVNRFYPESLAESWDNVGLQIGSKQKEIENVLTVLEITDEVVEEAIEKQIDLIVSHHPIIFKPIKNLNSDEANKDLITKLIKNDIAVYSMHTNVDIAENGMNDWLSEIIGIKNTRILRILNEEFYSFVSIETDPKYVDEIIECLNMNKIGKSLFNEENIWISPKIKRFRKKGDKESFEKDIALIEVIANKEQEKLLYHLLKDLKREKRINSSILVHELKNKKYSTGIGRYGEIRTQNLEQLVSHIEKKFDLNHIKFVGNSEKIVKKVAIVGGSGSPHIDDSIQKGCDVLITGDIGYHAAIEAASKGLCLIDAGHYIEIVFNDAMASFLGLFDELKVYSSKIDTDPFQNR